MWVLPDDHYQLILLSNDNYMYMYVTVTCTSFVIHAHVWVVLNESIPIILNVRYPHPQKIYLKWWKGSLVDNLILQLHLTLRRIGASNRNVGKKSCSIKLSTREPFFYHFMSAGATEKQRSLHSHYNTCSCNYFGSFEDIYIFKELLVERRRSNPINIF